MAAKMKPQDGQSSPLSPSGSSGIDVEAELGIHPVRRPMDIDQDVTDLGQKKRVSSVLTSPMFKEELETVVTDLLRSGDGGGHVIAREIVNMLSPHSMGVGCVSPINDITGPDIARYTKGEKLARCKLAALYRLVDLNGWSMQVYNHITYKVDKEQEHFLINPFGLLYHEVSAAKLLKINMQGDVIDQGTTNFPINKPGFMLHSAIHSGRPDINCVIHVHVPEVIAVSMMECGLLPISQESCIVGEVSYHPYQGLVVDHKERKALVKHLGPTNKVMFLRNHGMVACGETVEEAFKFLVDTIYACQTQIKVLSCIRLERVAILDKSIRTKVHHTVKEGGDTMKNKDDPMSWGYGEMTFEAYMRMLDNMGYRTGYPYKNSAMAHRRPRLRGEVELPATTHGNAILLDEIRDGKLHLQSSSARWVNSPNQYTKVHPPISEEDSSGPTSVNGDSSPKSRPRVQWSRDEGSSHSTPIRIADPNQFVPKNTDPREVAQKRKQIRGQGKWDERGPGPQSQKLDSFHADRRLQQDGVFTGSKGIIQRDYHDQTIVAGPPNPFVGMNEKEIENYTFEVTQKIKGESASEGVIVGREETVEHIIEVVAHVNEEPREEREDLMRPDVTNGPLQPEAISYRPREVEEVRPMEIQQHPASVNNNNKTTVAPTVEKVPAALPARKSDSVAKNKSPTKTNGGEIASPVSPAPKAVQEADQTVKTPEDVKNNAKGKHGKDQKTKEHKKQKRRSLSFLKKKKGKD